MFINHHSRRVSLTRPPGARAQAEGRTEEIMAELAHTRRFMERSTSIDVSVCVCVCVCVWLSRVYNTEREGEYWNCANVLGWVIRFTQVGKTNPQTNCQLTSRMYHTSQLSRSSHQSFWSLIFSGR